MLGPLIKQLADTLASIGALTVRTEDVAKGLRVAEDKVNALSERVTRLEMNYEHLKTSIRDSILIEVKVDMARMQMENHRLMSENDLLKASPPRAMGRADQPHEPAALAAG